MLTVKDIVIQGCGLISETYVLLKWLESNGFGPFLLTGVSLGGHVS